MFPFAYFGNSTLVNNLVLYLKLDGNSNDSINTSRTSTGTSITYTGSGKINQSANFSGLGYILFSDSSDWDFSAGDFAVSLWVKRDISGVLERIIGQVDSGGVSTNSSWQIRFNADNTIFVRVFQNTSFFDITSSNTISDINWHHIVLTRINTTLHLYNNNVQVGTVSVSGVTINNSTSTLGIGRHGDFTSNIFTGKIDEVGIWKGKGLTVGEISLLYNTGIGKQYPF